YNLGSVWTNVGAVSTSSALLLRSVDSVRFVPDADFSGTASITYVAWDQSGATAGQQGTKVNPGSPRGGATAFSTAGDTATVTVTEVNDSPIAVADSRSTDEDTPLMFSASDLIVNASRGPANESSQTLTVTA